ncbi:uncharacterized protein LOC115796787 [Archocentrus centrarchus]|uniref:uncharacterized protein LOC115796787 n=1 Tax=Archocentrus centrarchus TaxID=63155 RepID=UPI0011EA2A89|nr:uncharacterized protein LOC115796787 [Archocentrus centrarchus]
MASALVRSTVMIREKMICRILLLLILTSCVSGSFVVNVTQTSYQAEENHNITLEWTFTTNPESSPQTFNILCELITEHRFSLLYHVHEGVEVSESQDAKFSGRVQSDKDALREGRMRLQLSRLRTDDSGVYVCEVNTDDGFGVGRCQLNITAADQLEKETLSPKPKSPKSPGDAIFYVMLGMGLTATAVPLAFCLSDVIRNIKKESRS